MVARGALLCGVPQLSSSWIWCFENCQNCFSFSTNSTSAHSTPSPNTSCCQPAPGLGCLPTASEQMTFPWAPRELEHIGNSTFKMFSPCEQLTLLYWEMMHQAPGTARRSDIMEGHHSWSCASAPAVAHPLLWGCRVLGVRIFPVGRGFGVGIGGLVQPLPAQSCCPPYKGGASDIHRRYKGHSELCSWHVWRHFTCSALFLKAPGPGKAGAKCRFCWKTTSWPQGKKTSETGARCPQSTLRCGGRAPSALLHLLTRTLRFLSNCFWVGLDFPISQVVIGVLLNKII